MNQHFAISFLGSVEGQRQIAEQIHLLAQPKLALERIRTIQLPLPPIPEQQAIAGTLDGVEVAIDLESRTHVRKCYDR